MSKISDERREVAARLRTEVGEDESLDYPVCRIIDDELGVNGAFGAKAARILADLIDPTCEVESVDSTAGLPAYNLSCGDTVFVHLNELIPLYCPYCGARVVERGDA